MAAITVFFAHAEFVSLWTDHGVWTDLQNRAVFWHNQAVDVFFVLSGFILLYVHPPAGPIRWRDYVIARVARIYPLYIVATLLTAALFMAGSQRKGAAPFEKFSPQLLLENVLGVQQWSFHRGFEGSINFPAWSVSVELLLYVTLFPILWLFLRRIKVPGFGAWTLCALLLTTNGFVYALEKDLASGLFLLLRGYTAFAGGGFLYRALESGAARPPTKALLALSILVFSATAADFLPRAWLALSSLPLLYCVSQSNAFFRPPAVERTCRLLGDLSYGIYLLHFPIIKATRLFTGVWIVDAHYDVAISWSKKLLFVASTVGLVFLGAYLSYRYFETPARKWIRRRLAGET